MHFVTVTAAAILLSSVGVAYADSSSIPAPVIVPAPTPSVEAYDPNDCTSYPEACDRAANTDPNSPPLCGGAEDCDTYCNAVLPYAPYGVMSTCESTTDYPGGGTTEGVCTCLALTAEADAAIVYAITGISEMTCIVIDEALAIGQEELKLLGIVSGQTEVKWLGRIFKVAGLIYAQGSELGDCPNDGCPGHQFVAIDPEKVEDALGWLNVC